MRVRKLLFVDLPQCPGVRRIYRRGWLIINRCARPNGLVKVL